MIEKRFKKGLAILMSAALLAFNVQPIQAAMVGNETLIEQAEAGADRDRLAGLLARAEVRGRLAEVGVDASSIEQRLARLTDAEVAELNARFDQLPAGGDALGVALVIFIVFVITDVIGATDIFPFIKPVKQ